MGILNLTIEKKWFDMILSGEKKEEYRDIKPFYDNRFKKEYTKVKLTNGYGKHRPSVILELKSVSKGVTKGDIAPVGGKETYVLHLGKILTIKNIL